jgi:hypothetical protein
MDFWLHDAGGNVLFEGRCGDIDADWWHGFEPLKRANTCSPVRHIRV